MAKQIEARLVLGDAGILEKTNQRVPTLKEYVYGWDDTEAYQLGWLEKVAKLSLKNSTRNGYQQILKAYLIPAFGSKRLNQINSRLIGDFIYAQFKEGRRSGTVKNIKNCLSSVLKHACDQDGYIESNPARGIVIPRPEDEVPAREPAPFTWDERDEFETILLENFPRYYPLVVCGFRAGLRIGELVALQWQDIDFYNRLILVQRNITRGKITTPKNISSTRKVRMTSQLIDVLRAHRRRLKEEKLKKGWDQLPEWVFCNETGSYINYGNFVHRVWNRAMEKSGLSRRTSHDLRHTYATLRLSKGDSLAEVSKEMGHSSTDITFRTYYKWLPKESRSDIDELDGTWLRMQPSATYTQPKMKKG